MATKNGRRRGAVIAGVTAAVLVASTAIGYGVIRYGVSAEYPQSHTETLAVAQRTSVEVADPAKALTFARVQGDSGPRLLLVRSYQDDQIVGVPVPGHADPIDAFAALGYDGLRELARDGSATTQNVPAGSLVLPFEGHSRNIAMGTNYPEHGEETSVDSAFLFPKTVAPTPASSDLPVGDGLLDYEVELGLVPLAALRDGDADPAHMGLVLTNDWTDRETMLEQADLGNIASGEGFTNAKSESGFLTVGDLFVIPADWQSYYRELRLELYVNGRMRQSGTPADQIWDASRMIDEIFAAKDRTWDDDGRPTTVTDEIGIIPARTVLQAGTPEGVTFRPPTGLQIAAGAIEQIATLGQGADSFVDAAVQVYIDQAREDKAYLQAGDEVVTRADGLGRIITDIVPGDRDALS